MNDRPYVSRGGEKLAGALDHFQIDITGCLCADFGSHIGGFVDCLLQRGAGKIYSIDTAYGLLAWKLRKDPRVVVMERTNAMHVALPEPVDLVTIDVGWTPQQKILPAAASVLKPTGRVVTLIKPHYEAGPLAESGAGPFRLERGVLPEEEIGGVLDAVSRAMIDAGWHIVGTAPSTLRGHGGNREFLSLLLPRLAPDTSDE